MPVVHWHLSSRMDDVQYVATLALFCSLTCLLCLPACFAQVGGILYGCYYGTDRIEVLPIYSPRFQDGLMGEGSELGWGLGGATQ